MVVGPSWKIDRAATVDGLVSVKNLTYNPSTLMSAVGSKPRILYQETCQIGRAHV